MVHAISDDRLGAAPLDPCPADAEATYSAHLLASAVRRAVQAGGAHRRAVLRSWLLTIPVVAAVVALLFWGSAPVGAWAASWAVLDVVLPRSPGGHTWQDAVRSSEALLGALFIVAVLLAVSVLWGMVRRYLAWRRPEPDASPLPW